MLSACFKASNSLVDPCMSCNAQPLPYPATGSWSSSLAPGQIRPQPHLSWQCMRESLGFWPCHVCAVHAQLYVTHSDGVTFCVLLGCVLCHDACNALQRYGHMPMLSVKHVTVTMAVSMKRPCRLMLGVEQTGGTQQPSAMKLIRRSSAASW